MDGTPQAPRFTGLRIVTSPLLESVPVLQVRDNVPMTDEGRANMNKWLLDMFGTRDVVMFMNGGVVMSPSAFVQLQNEIKAKSF